MAEVVLDGKAVHSEVDVHRALAQQLEFGEFYGSNLSALRDRLLTDTPRPVRIVWLGSGRSRERLGEPLFSSIVAVFEEAAQQDLDFGWADRFEFELR
ncbi:barstar family protein [Pimelobacter simplex]|uniref:barstar family protein n=1 Tax=Nocardioides simplex TaxID=2045 RepID=UPI00193326B3|nr:barstar family protein [Pimelobacter simplex]